jgi:signal transduction histidine kinase
MRANILVIDDELTVCRSCEKILRDGHKVSMALSGREGLERARRENFDLVIVDLKMPDIDGMEVVEAIKRERPDMEVIIMTGYSTIPSAVKGIKLGAADYVPKPFTPDEMLTAVREALNNKERKAAPPGLTGGSLLLNNEAIAEVLNRAAEDEEFKEKLLNLGSSALREYDLTHAERSALASVIDPSEEAIRVVSHELKSPLASIASLARAIQEPNVPGDQKDKFLNRIIFRAEGALGMIDEHLTMSKISSGEIELKLQKVNLFREIIQKSLDDQKEAMNERGMSAIVHVPEDLEVVCDPYYIRIVYNNLISNASKYGTGSTQIQLGYPGTRDGYHYFNVANVGQWIKEGDRKRIFEKYVTLGRRGTGVGLHTTMRIIKEHGGDIWVEPGYFVRGEYIAAESVIEETAESERHSDKLVQGNNFVFTIPEEIASSSDKPERG